jgi:hypothetical protein
MTILKKSQFKDDGTGILSITAHIQPKTEGGLASKLESGSVSYASSNENVARVTENADDENKLTITWMGAGDVQIQATGDADLDAGDDQVKSVSGTLDLKLEEDEASTIEIILDETPV